MIPFTSALFALRCHVIDLLPTGLMFLGISYALVIRAMFTSVVDNSSDNSTLSVEDLTYNLFNI
ncbi:uncharacterized protein CELE_C09H10.4 [Caenorhabditis elegans]|uniref:Uncharacterized protein n=1 Tax=Caenorhabditis elegans TaxID=6239 RepID=E3W727_CAEEL|nr:Uncharacterized protein CELE_C09H10.4 [Caenorhabditis elegans]CBX53311.1 Uncharacterized protein CELE_C09H10.4 [Caenorhabditis elegans]|eukprot:NP_001254274.1 Uncharacterized protein CELE_C09H10.4 [Caenorhabditis elegans]